MIPKSGDEMPVTIFSWGYYGWGNHTRRLVEAVDAVEASRGFRPPVFVDIRIRRSVRAAGFTGPAFEKLLEQGRHRWMKSLGNKFIQTELGSPSRSLSPRPSKNFSTSRSNRVGTSSACSSSVVVSGPSVTAGSPATAVRSWGCC